MSTMQDLLNSLLPVLGEAGVNALADKLKDLSAGADESWKKTILDLMANAVEKEGPQGIQLALTYINDLMDGKEVEIDWADLQTASDIVGQLQNAEADRKTAVNDFLAKASEVLGTILMALIKGLMKG